MPTELFASRIGRHVWAALREEGSIVELRVEPADGSGRVGRVIKARVANVVPAIQAAFVEIGAERHAFLHASDLLLPGERPGPAAAREAPIQDRLKVGRELVVQVVRESPASKGDRVSCHVALPGRWLVLFPQRTSHGVSRRIEDPAVRSRLLEQLEDLGRGEAFFVARTAAAAAAGRALAEEAAALLDSWRDIRDRAATAKAPTLLHEELPLVLRILQDTSGRGLERVVVDDAEDRDLAQRFVRQTSAAVRVELHDDPHPLFDVHGVRREIDRALRPRVWLASGGHIVIEQTEALVSIDVNTGRSVQGTVQETTMVETNLEAVAEIARQLRLRDLGGIVVVDFLAMDSECGREKIVAALRQALARDPARTKLLGLSELGLVELTRSRVRASVSDAVLGPCPLCSGRGRLRRPEIVADEALTALRRAMRQSAATERTVRAHPDVVQAIREGLDAVGRGRGDVPRVRLRSDSRLDPQTYEIV